MQRITNILLFLAAAAIIAYAVFFHDNDRPARFLPVFGPKTFVAKIGGGTDTVYHQVPPFSFLDQNGKVVTHQDVANSVYVTDFFFTTCHSICPVMSSQMERVARKFKGEPQVMILSHTVDPETDSVPQLAAYALRHQADPAQWKFLTGDKKALYEIARKGYMLDAQEGNGGAEDFIHTQNFALVDKDRRIRGYYNGIDSADVDQLLKDIDLLLREYKWKSGK